MAKISDGYTIGAIDACLKEVMTCKRKLQLRTQPLTNAELINVLWWVYENLGIQFDLLRAYLLTALGILSIARRRKPSNPGGRKHHSVAVVNDFWSWKRSACWRSRLRQPSREMATKRRVSTKR